LHPGEEAFRQTFGLVALMIAECIPSATECVGVIETSSKPVERKPVSYSEKDIAPAMQPT
jgi:hypothetical protein